MLKRYKRMISLCVTIAFLTLLPIYSQPLPAGQALSQDEDANRQQAPAQNFIEKEQQVGYQASPRNILPILLGIAAVAAGVFLLVMLVSKEKYVIEGEWNFHNDYTTAGYTDFESVWTFTPYDSVNKAMGRYIRNENGATTQGEYTIVNKSEVVFLDAEGTEQYVGQFDSKTTMSGTFVIANGAGGNWTATKK